MGNYKKKNIKGIRDAVILSAFFVCTIIELGKELWKIDRMSLFAVIITLTIYGFFAQRIIHFVEKHNKNIKEELEKGIISDKNTPRRGKLFDKNIIAEYDISNLLSPVEAGFLYDMQIGKPDIVCIIYKRAGMGIIKLSQKNGSLIIKKTGKIKKKQLPSYEYAFREILFTEGNSIKFPNQGLYEKLKVIRKGIEKYCIQKGRIYKKEVNSIIDTSKRGNYSNREKFIPFGRLFGLSLGILLLLLCLLVIKKNIWIEGTAATKLGICMGIGIPFIIVYIGYYIISIRQTMKKHTLKLTDTGKELVTKIHGYKKFLESCEERQLKEFMKEDPLYVNKVLPYAVALGLENVISDKIPQKILDDKAKDIFLLEKII